MAVVCGGLHERLPRRRDELRRPVQLQCRRSEVLGRVRTECVPGVFDSSTPVCFVSYDCRSAGCWSVDALHKLDVRPNVHERGPVMRERPLERVFQLVGLSDPNAHRPAQLRVL
jgi:hypothetical protein